MFILGVALKILHISLSGRTPKILLRFWFVQRWFLTIFQTKCWNPWNFLVPKTSPPTQEILVQSMTLKFRTDVFNENPHVFNMYFISLPCLLYFRVYFLYLIKVYNFPQCDLVRQVSYRQIKTQKLSPSIIVLLVF